MQIAICIAQIHSVWLAQQQYRQSTPMLSRPDAVLFVLGVGGQEMHHLSVQVPCASLPVPPLHDAGR
jgi:hypothetical protein